MLILKNSVSENLTFDPGAGLCLADSKSRAERVKRLYLLFLSFFSHKVKKFCLRTLNETTFPLCFCVFLAPIRSQNGGDRLELVW